MCTQGLSSTFNLVLCYFYHNIVNMHSFNKKLNNFRTLFLLFIFFSIILIIFNIWFPNEAFAMSPPQDTDDVIRSFNPDTYTRHELDGKSISKVDKSFPKVDKPRFMANFKPSPCFRTDYYGYVEYMRDDAYGYYHKPQNLDKATQVEPLSFTKGVYENSYNSSNNPDYQLSDNRTNYQGSKCKPEHELHLSKGKNVYFLSVLDKQPVVYELDADQYEDTISTSMNSTRFNKAIEFVRNYKVLADHPKHGMLSSLSLGIKTINNNIVFLYIQIKEIGRRKILWNIWDKNRGKYESYTHFKRSLDSNTSIWSKIEKDVREDIRRQVEDLLGIKKIKKDLKRSVRKEVEKLLRDTRPFII